MKQTLEEKTQMTTLKLKPAFRHLFMILFSFIMVYPVIWWIGASLKHSTELGSPSIFPAVPQWSNFTKRLEFGWDIRLQISISIPSDLSLP